MCFIYCGSLYETFPIFLSSAPSFTVPIWLFSTLLALCSSLQYPLKKHKVGSSPSAPAVLVLVRFLPAQVGSPRCWRRFAVRAGMQLGGMPNGFSIPAWGRGGSWAVGGGSSGPRGSRDWCSEGSFTILLLEGLGVRVGQLPGFWH